MTGVVSNTTPEGTFIQQSASDYVLPGWNYDALTGIWIENTQNSTLTNGPWATASNTTGALRINTEYEQTRYSLSSSTDTGDPVVLLKKAATYRYVQGETIQFAFDGKYAEAGSSIAVRWVFVDASNNVVAAITPWYTTGSGTNIPTGTLLGTTYANYSTNFSSATLATGNYHLALQYDSNVTTAAGSSGTEDDVQMDRLYLGNSTVTGTSASEVLIGQTGYANNIIAGDGDDILRITTTLVDTLSGGNGTDTLQFVGAGMVLDLTDTTKILANSITGIEVVDLTGSGNNTLRLKLSDIVSMSDTDTLRVLGNAGDTVVISNGGTAVAATAQSLHGIAYNGYDIDGNGTIDLYTLPAVGVQFV